MITTFDASIGIIKGYDGIKPTRNQLETIVKKYVNKQYDLGQKERGILIDQIVERIRVNS